jgi:diguanylate cyclase (GGDEF)-like protein
VVLSGLYDEDLALKAVKAGAQDFLIKGEADGGLVARSILYAMERKRSEESIYRLAHYDGLTEVPNRRLLHDRLRQALARARRESRIAALLFLDLDQFKEINDTLGHAAGDLLLRAVARRLVECTRASDTVARLGGDEFAVVLPEVGHVEDVSKFARKILGAFRVPFSIERRELQVSASIGIGLYPVDGLDAESLLRSADIAMYHAKQGGKNNYQFSFPAANVQATRELELGKEIRHALKREEFVLHYQPIVDLRSGRMVSAEALVRWRSPSCGLLQPARFLTLAEETGLIVPLGE